MKIKFLTTLILCIGLQGCITAPASTEISAQEYRARIVITDDEFTKITTFKGTNLLPGGLDNYFFVRAFKDERNNKFNYQIYVNVTYYGEWIHFSSAYDSNGEVLDFSIIDRKVNSCLSSTGKCILNEVIGINMTQEQFEKYVTSGIKFKILGKNGERIYFIPPAYVESFIS
jgi:hypothetical protein